MDASALLWHIILQHLQVMSKIKNAQSGRVVSFIFLYGRNVCLF